MDTPDRGGRAAGAEQGVAISADGTEIAYDLAGGGPAVLLVGGGLDDGAENAPLAAELAGRMTVVNYCRRGRGRSGDTAPYAVEREIEDMASLLDVMGGSGAVFGASSGGALALRAAAAGLPIRSLAVYEVPYYTDRAQAAGWPRYVEELGALIRADDRDGALELFMRLAGSAEDDIAGARADPVWEQLRALAPTLAYDAACIGPSGMPPVEQLSRVRPPVLALTGSALDPAMAGLPTDFFAAAADVIVRTVPDGRRQVVATASHAADPVALAPALTDFFIAS